MRRAAERTPGGEDVAAASGEHDARRWVWAALALVLLGGLGLRLWGIRQGLPYAYNLDEDTHFVPKAVHMFGANLNPHYFANPPAFTYLLHYLFAVWFGGGAGVQRTFALHPQELYTLGRVAAALLGTAALWLLYLTGARLFGRAVGLLAAAIEAVAFLPVFYAHLALNDVPTLAPLTLSLLGIAGIAARAGRARDYLLAGVGLGLAAASKYTAGIVLVPLLAAVTLRALNARGDSKDDNASGSIGASKALLGLALAGVAALAAFLIANPYAALDYQSFHAELVHQSSLSAEAQGKLGAPQDGGLVYYLWSLTWGLGWVPAVFALAGALTIWRSEPRRGWLLVPAPLLFLVFMGLQGRYFGRWLLPIFPIMCLLAAVFAIRLANAFAARARAQRSPGDNPGAWRHAFARHGVAALLVALLLAQGLVFSIHSGLVLSRADTRNLTRAWMLAHIPKGAKIVAEPVSPNEWADEAHGAPPAPACPPYRWCKYPSLFSRISAGGSLEPKPIREVGIENYVRTLYPVLLDYYESHGYCWVVSGSTQSGRAFADAPAVPHAIAYYRALAARGEVVYRASPYSSGEGPVAFNFDWSFDYYPLAYRRPGPQMTVYRLRDGDCST